MQKFAIHDIPRRRLTGPSRRVQRRGAVYIFVLAISMLVAVIAMGVLTAARINGRVVTQSNDAAEAQGLAESAVEFALQAIANDPNWRSDYPAGLSTGALAIGNGSVKFSLLDDVDGNLSNNAYDTVRLHGTGQVRSATRIYSVQCRPGVALDCLGVSIAIGGQASLSNLTLSGAPALLLACNSGISATNVNFASTASLQGSPVTVTGCSGAITTAAGGTRQLPDPSHAFEYYVDHGTAIPISNIPAGGSGHVLQWAVLSPASNPYGAVLNPQGIYIIDCQGQSLQMLNMRVVGTLVILNPGSLSGLLQSNYMAPSVVGWPSLMVRGDWSLASASTNLVDNPATGDAQVPSINYNPPGTPYLGAADSTFTTSYPSRIDGLVYVSGNLAARQSPCLAGGLIVGGTFFQSSGILNITYAATASLKPPPGFTSHVMVPVGGSWRWEKVR